MTKINTTTLIMLVLILKSFSQITGLIPQVKDLPDNNNFGVMTFGDGDGVTKKHHTTLDIVAHEFTHGITEHFVEFYSSGKDNIESTSLSESFSDIFGTFIEFYGTPEKANWLMGEDMQLTAIAERNIANPNSLNHPKYYLGLNWSNTNRHANSCVHSHAYYLLSEGGNGITENEGAYSVMSIGIEKTDQIAFRTVSVYLKNIYQNWSGGSDPRNMINAGFFAIESAKDLFGNCSHESNQVINAFFAIGVVKFLPDVSGFGLLAEYPVDCITYPSNNSNYIEKFNTIISPGENCFEGSVIVPFGADVTYAAGTKIVLKHGFKAEHGSRFKAHIYCNEELEPLFKKKNSTQQTKLKFDTKTTSTPSLFDENFSIKKDAKIYPNPGNDYFIIQFTDDTKLPNKLILKDISGRIVLEKIVSSHTTQIDVSNFDKGIYFITSNELSNFFTYILY
jgi:hypothetical protein